MKFICFVFLTFVIPASITSAAELNILPLNGKELGALYESFSGGKRNDLGKGRFIGYLSAMGHHLNITKQACINLSDAQMFNAFGKYLQTAKQDWSRHEYDVTMDYLKRTYPCRTG